MFSQGEPRKFICKGRKRETEERRKEGKEGGRAEEKLGSGGEKHGRGSGVIPPFTYFSAKEQLVKPFMILFLCIRKWVWLSLLAYGFSFFTCLYVMSGHHAEGRHPACMFVFSLKTRACLPSLIHCIQTLNNHF